MKGKLLAVTIGWWIGIFLVFYFNVSWRIMTGIGLFLIVLTTLSYSAPNHIKGIEKEV